MPYRTMKIREESPPKKVWKMPENIKDRIDAFGLLNFILSVICFAIAGITHAVAIPNDKIPHTDPLLTQVFLFLAIVMASIGILIFTIRFSWFLIKVIKGDETF